MIDHVTNTEEVKFRFADYGYLFGGTWYSQEQERKRFDNWLREELAKAWDNGRLSRPEQENPHR